MIEELERTFLAAADPQIATAQATYMRDLFPFFGIKKPHRALLEKPFFKTISEENFHPTMHALWKRKEREFHYAALGLAKHHKKLWTPEILPLFESMIRTHSWWDTVDDIASNLVGALVIKYPELALLMDHWIVDPDFWIRRTALLHQLKWKKATDEERLFAYCEKTFPEKEFFIRKAIGWVLREYSKTHPESVRKFLSKHQQRMNNLSIREASKYL
jgi:3-methyladenine DNA glycosylase AlkD